jgi:hypothetical protein
MRPEYKAFIKEAKLLRIKTHDELYSLCLEDRHQSISGGEFECAKKILKIKS